jgi:serine/threonine protein kinase
VTDFVKSLTTIEPAKRLTALGALDHPWMDMSLNPDAESRSQNPTEGSETMVDTENPSNVWPDGFGAQPKSEQTTRPKTQPPSNTGPDEPSVNLSNGGPGSEKAAEAHKESGNQLFKEEKYDLAIEQYTKGTFYSMIVGSFHDSDHRVTCSH